MANTCNTIVLVERGESPYDEAIASGIFSPGHHLMMDSNLQVLKSTALGLPGEMIIATEDALQGKTVNDAYAVGDPARLHFCAKGDRLFVRLPANAVAVVKGDFLAPDGGGCFIKTLLNSVGKLYSNVVSSAPVTNTVTETAFDKSYTIPANLLKVGDIIKIKGEVLVTNQHTTDTLNIKLKIGTTLIVASGALDVATNDVCVFEALLTIRTIGASGTFVAEGTISIGVPGTATVRSFNVASTAIDTTVGQLVSVTATWSVADATNIADLEVLEIETAPSTFATPVLRAAESIDNSAVAAEAFIKVAVV